MNDIKFILLSQGKLAVVDIEDYEWLNQWKWSFGCKGYAVRQKKDARGKVKSILMHRVINKTPAGLETDHVNAHKTDNRKSNLRTSTSSNNSANRVKIQGKRSSRYKGVSWDKLREKWRVRIEKKGKSVDLGRFYKEEEAALTYDKAAVELFGQFCRLNFPVMENK